nr:MAG TPA: hypothetical protein [Caudoviricetes sp.]
MVVFFIQHNLSCLFGFLYVDDLLVTGAAPFKAEVTFCDVKGTCNADVDAHNKWIILDFAPFIARPKPDGFIGKSLLEGNCQPRDIHRVLICKRFAAKNRKTCDVVVHGSKNFFHCVFCEVFAACEVPCFLIKTTGAMDGAAAYKEANSYSWPICNVELVDLGVVHLCITRLCLMRSSTSCCLPRLKAVL